MRHLRGRVYADGEVDGKTLWRCQVINENTGKVVMSDDACSWERIFSLAECATVVARGAWMFSYRKGELS